MIRKGFTLIELMIVIAIVSILVALAMPMFQKEKGDKGFVCDALCQVNKLECTLEQLQKAEIDSNLCRMETNSSKAQTQCIVSAKRKHCKGNYGR